MEAITFAIWTKVCCLIFLLPFIIYNGIPNDPLFYLFTFCSALIWSIADIIMWRSIPIIGSGVFSRTIPLSVIISFLLWFLIDPSLFEKYANQPTISALILGVLVLSTYFAIRLKKCTVTSSAVRRVWFVIAAFAVSPIIAMLAIQHAPIQQGAWSFVFFEALFMLMLWAVYIRIKKPIKVSSLISIQNFKFGIISGIIMALMVTTYIYGLYHTENPGYILALISLEAAFVSFINHLRKKKDDSDIWAGLGVVACVIVLIILKTQIQ